MSFNVNNFIAAPNESLLIDSKVDDNGNFQNLYLKWGCKCSNIQKGKDITYPILEPILDDLLVSPDHIKKLEKLKNGLRKPTYRLDLSDKLKNLTQNRGKKFTFKIIESQYNLKINIY